MKKMKMEQLNLFISNEQLLLYSDTTNKYYKDINVLDSAQNNA